jgi:hypothetical protein
MLPPWFRHQTRMIIEMQSPLAVTPLVTPQVLKIQRLLQLRPSSMYVIGVFYATLTMAFLTKDVTLAKKRAKRATHKAAEVCFAFKLYSEPNLAEFTDSAPHCSTVNLERCRVSRS